MYKNAALELLQFANMRSLIVEHAESIIVLNDKIIDDSFAFCKLMGCWNVLPYCPYRQVIRNKTMHRKWTIGIVFRVSFVEYHNIHVVKSVIRRISGQPIALCASSRFVRLRFFRLSSTASIK